MTDLSAKQNKKHDGGRFAGLIFTAGIIAVCVAVFLLSDEGSELLAKFGTGANAAVKANAVVLASPEPAKDPDTAFIEALASDGFDADVLPCSGAADEHTSGWNISYRDAPQALNMSLTLSHNKKNVTAFTLSWQAYACEKAPENGEADFNKTVREKNNEIYGRGIALFKSTFTALAYALDSNGKLTNVDIDASASDMDAALSDGKQHDDKMGGMAFSTYVKWEGDRFTLTASLSQ